MQRIVILVSGRGSNMAAVHQRCAAEGWPARVVAVVTNRAGAGALAHAAAHGIATAVVDHQAHATRQAFDDELARVVESFSPDLVLLAGFSQGCAIGLGAGLRHPERLAGLAGLSGYVPLADTTAAERHAANQDTRVFLAHGRGDGVVPLARGAAGRDLLQSLGHPVEWHDYPMEHSVCMEEVQALNRWLLQVLA